VVQDPGLSIGFSGATLTPAFDAAIADLSQNGSLNGLYGYFAEQGTIQTGTAGDDVMLSFGGNDSFTGGLGNDTLVFADGWANDVVLDFHAAAGDFDILDLQGVTNISNYVDLFFNHSNWWDNSNVLTITDGANSIQLDGYVGTDMLGLILDGHFTV
jgi:Ca2+-binding RTX toxin-like protein